MYWPPGVLTEDETSTVFKPGLLTMLHTNPKEKIYFNAERRTWRFVLETRFSVYYVKLLRNCNEWTVHYQPDIICERPVISFIPYRNCGSWCKTVCELLGLVYCGHDESIIIKWHSQNSESDTVVPNQLTIANFSLWCLSTGRLRGGKKPQAGVTVVHRHIAPSPCLLVYYSPIGLSILRDKESSKCCTKIVG